MAKRKETLEIEERLHYMTQNRRIYGCEEVTIGFYRNGHGNEIVDFCTMDSHGVLRCYEIKVTLADLKSKAKKSWYGHYNYLFVTADLYAKICNELDKYIPSHIGVAIPCSTSWSDGVEIRRNAKKQELSLEQENMLKESLIRSMSYKLQKARKAADLKYIADIEKKLRKNEKECKKQNKEIERLGYIIRKTERMLRRFYDCEVDLAEIVEKAEHQNYFFPEEINLTLTDAGNRYNKNLE